MMQQPFILASNIKWHARNVRNLKMEASRVIHRNYSLTLYRKKKRLKFYLSTDSIDINHKREKNKKLNIYVFISFLFSFYKEIIVPWLYVSVRVSDRMFQYFQIINHILWLILMRKTWFLCLFTSFFMLIVFSKEKNGCCNFFYIIIFKIVKKITSKQQHPFIYCYDTLNNFSFCLWYQLAPSGNWTIQISESNLFFNVHT